MHTTCPVHNLCVELGLLAFLYHHWMTVLKRSLGNQLQFCHECLCGALAACSDAFAGGNKVECYGLKLRRHNSKLQSKERLISWCHWSTRSCKLKGSSCIVSATLSYSTHQVAIQSGSFWRWPELGTLTQSCIGWFLHTSSQLNRLRCWYRRWKNRALLLLGGGPTLYPTVLPFDYN